MRDKYYVTTDNLDDDVPDDQGLTAVCTPEDAEPDEDVEDEDAFAALREDLSPGEASRVLEDMRPLSDEEVEIIRNNPGLRGLRRVDDAEEEERLRRLNDDGYRAMDRVLDDAVFGENTMDNEEKLERLGYDDLGWGIPGLSSLKKAARGLARGVRGAAKGAYGLGKRGIRTPFSVARRGVRKLGGLVKKFVPGRDAGKAKLVRNLNAKLVREHANWLGLQDQRAGRPVQPPGAYRQQAKLWAVQKIAAGGLPTKFAVSGADVLGADILGEDEVGSWWNPFSWFAQKSQVIVQSTAAERSEVGPDGQPLEPSPYDQAEYPQQAESSPEESYPAESYPEESPEDYASGIGGEDSLGAFAAEILSGTSSQPPPRKSTAPSSRESELVEIASRKLEAGQPLSAGELAVLATLAKAGNVAAKKLYAKLAAEGAAVSGDDAGAWMHRLNPAYWWRGKDYRQMKDKESDAWKKNQALREDLEKRQLVLAQAERAKTATEAVEQARQQAAATESQLKAIKDSLAGALRPTAEAAGSFVGHEKPTAVDDVVRKALDSIGKQSRAEAIYAKLARGEALTKEDVRDAREITRALHKVKVVHGDLWKTTPPELAMMHGAFVGACLTAGVDSARRRNLTCGKAAQVLGAKLARGEKLTPDEKKAARVLFKDTAKLREVVRSFTSGAALRDLELEKATGIRRASFVGAAASMTPVEKKMVAAIVKLAKAGNPRAQKSLAQLKQSGMIAGGDVFVSGDDVGFSLKTAFKYATAPIWLPAKGIAKAAKWTGQKLGVVSTKKSAQEVRLAKMRAAAKRRAALQARARKADAETEAELRAQESIASAAEAEAEAADAEALAKEAAMRTAEKEADPEAALSESDDSSGAFVGSWTDLVGEGDDSGAAARAKKIVAEAGKKTPVGTKIRAGAKLYQKVRTGDPTARKALSTMIKKAQAGDPQAKKDVKAVWAGREAMLAKQKAQKKETKKLVARARKLKVRAVQARLEAAAANKLARTERRVRLARVARVERRAAAGDKKARAYVAQKLESARKGDKKAAKVLKQITLAKEVRRAAPNKRERRNLAQASRLYRSAQKGNRKSIRTIMVLQAAAKKGNPNAKRAVKRLAVAKKVEVAVATGAIGLGAAAVAAKATTKGKAEKSAVLERASAKLAAGSASREELAAGAKAAQELGDREAAGKLAVAATRAPSATASLSKTASVVSAKNMGDPEAKAAVQEAFESAKSGDPEAIKRMGKVVAVQTIADVEKGRPVPEAMRDAVNLQERVAAGDPQAKKVAALVAEQATGPSPSADATAAAITLSAAAVTARALAAKPAARREYLEKVNAFPAADRPAAEQQLAEYAKSAQEGTISPEDGAVAVRLAERLGKPKVAAKIAAMAPPPPEPTPMSTLPDAVQQPIAGVAELLRESLRAITLSTRDPLANWREGVASRSRAPAPTASAGISDVGWSPFAAFRAVLSKLNIVAPATALAASAASLATALQAKKQVRAAKASAAPAAPVAPQPPRARSPEEKVAKKEEKPEEVTATSGAERTFRDYVSAALSSKKIARRDFNRAVEMQVGPKAASATKQAVGEKVLQFLAKNGVKVET